MPDTEIGQMTTAGRSQENHGTIFPIVNNGTNYHSTFETLTHYIHTGYFSSIYGEPSVTGLYGEIYGRFKVLAGNVLLTGRTLLKAEEVTGVFKKLMIGNFPTNRATGQYSQILGGSFNSGFVGDYQFILGGDHNKIVGGSSFIAGGSYNQVSGGALTVEGLPCSLNDFVLCGIGNSASGAYSYVGNGQNNVSIGGFSTVINGYNNIAFGNLGLIGAGQYNKIGKNSLSCVVVGGDGNTVSGNWNGILGGYYNSFFGAVASDTSLICAGSTNEIYSNSTNSNNSCIIAGSENDLIDSANTVIIGGSNNSITLSQYSLIGGGYGNAILSDSQHCVIVAGSQNQITQAPLGLGRDFIGAGANNIIYGEHDVIVGGYWNQVSGSASTIVGGYQNLSKGHYNFIGGGLNNFVTGNYSLIVGGNGNAAGFVGTDLYSVVAGGGSNRSFGNGASVLGGINNLSSGDYSVSVGGSSNLARGPYVSILGGYFNTGFASGSVVAGGKLNVAQGAMSSVLGGEANNASGAYSIVAGGLWNVAQSGNSSVLGGIRNIARATGAVIVAGSRNTIYGSQQSMIGAGNLNSINGTGMSVILQGQSNTISSGGYNTIANGHNVNIHSSNFSFAAGKDITINSVANFAFGQNITSNHSGVTILGDASSSSKTSVLPNSAYLYYQSGVHIKGPFILNSGATPLGQYSPTGMVGEFRWDAANMYLYGGPNVGWRTIAAPVFGSVAQAKTAINYTFISPFVSTPFSHGSYFTKMELGGAGGTFLRPALALSGPINFTPTSMSINAGLAVKTENPGTYIRMGYSTDPFATATSWTAFGPQLGIGSTETIDTQISATGVLSLGSPGSTIYIQPLVFSSATGSDPTEAFTLIGLDVTVYGLSS